MKDTFQQDITTALHQNLGLEEKAQADHDSLYQEWQDAVKDTPDFNNMYGVSADMMGGE